MISNFFNNIPQEILGFATMDLVIIYLIIGLIVSLSVIMYNCTEAIIYKRQEDIDLLFPEHTLFLGIFLLFFYPIPLFLFIIEMSMEFIYRVLFSDNEEIQKEN